jgi:predicted permease
MFSRRTHDDFRDEVHSHLDLETDRLIADGMSPNDAHAEARRRFGNVSGVEERFYEASRVAWLDHLWRDVRYAVRGLRRAPSCVLTTTLTLAVAIGLLTTAFAVVNGFLRPYAIRDPGGLYQVSWRAHESASRLFRWSDYDEFRRRTDLFSALAGEDVHMVSSSGQPVLASVVSLDYFDALGPVMRVGRGLAPMDAGANTAVLSDPAWQRIFDRDPAILDRDIELNGRMHRIVGVLGSEFSGLGGQPSDVLVPRPAVGSASGGTPDAPPPGTIIVARLAAGVTVPRAEGALAGFMRARFDREPDVAAVVEPHPGPNELTLQVIAILTPVFVPFVLVLVTACANVSNVMLARAIRRQREIAVRLSIGASRARVVMQLLTEGACLAAIAGAAGLALSAWGLRLVPELLVSTLPASLGPILRLPRLDFDIRVFTFVVGTSTAATMLFALAPALQASRIRPVDSLRGQRHGSPRGARLRHTLVVAQVASALMLVVAAITLAHNGAGMSRHDLGFDPAGVISVNVRGTDDRATRPLADALAADPRVADLAVTSGNPLFNGAKKVAAVPGGGQQATPTDLTFVSPEFFSMLRVPIDRGRAFTAAEARDAEPVAIVSDATALAFWPGEDAIGKTIRLDRTDDRRLNDLPGYPALTVIGTVRDMTTALLVAGHDRGHIYLPIARGNTQASAILVRGRGDRDLSPAALQEIFRRVAPEPQIFEALPLSDIRDLQTWPLLAASWVGALLAAIAFGLGMSGLYGVLTYALSDRQKEIGIRLALGASPRNVVTLVLRQGGTLAATGAAIGLALALGGLGTLASVVHLRNVTLVDAGAFAIGIVLVVLATLAATAQPALRASRVSPSETLRIDAQ